MEWGKALVWVRDDDEDFYRAQTMLYDENLLRPDPSLAIALGPDLDPREWLESASRDWDAWHAHAFDAKLARERRRMIWGDTVAAAFFRRLRRRDPGLHARDLARRREQHARHRRQDT